MLICCSLFFVSKIVFWQASGFGDFLLERILLAVVCAGLSGVDMGMLFLSCGQGKSHSVFGIYENLQQAGLLLAAAIYGLWVGSDYRLAALLTVFSYGVAALLAAFLQEVKLPEERRITVRESVNVLASQLKDRKLLLFLISVALVNETHQVITVFLNQLKYTSVEMNAQWISWAYVLLSIFGLVSVFSAYLSKRMGEKRLGIGLILGSLMCCLMLTVTKNPIVSVTAVVGLRSCYSLLQPLQQEQQNRRVHAKHRATALSMNAAFMSSVAVFLNLVFGYVADTNLSTAMLLGAGLCMAALLLYCKSE